jgi:hypothetical protein
MEEFFEALTGGAVWGAGFAAAAALVGGLGRGLRPAVKTVIRGGVAAGDWFREVTAESREALQDIYEEAKAERAAAPGH